MFVVTVVLFITGFIFHGSVLAAEDVTPPQGFRRVIWGQKAEIDAFPYQVSIEMSGHQICGGSIVHDQLVLTAAHCVATFPMSILSIRAGTSVSESGGQHIGIRRVKVHEAYVDDDRVDKDDIALILLQRPIVYGPQAQPIQLSTESPTVGQRGWVTGYGRQTVMMPWNRSTKLNWLMAVELPIVDTADCKDFFLRKNEVVAEGMFCAGGRDGRRDSCRGDSGGPLAIGGKVAGITAWGLGCGLEGFPGMYTDVAMYNSWISENSKTLLATANSTYNLHL